MSFKTFVKDPDAVLDYSIDWTDWLQGDTIANSTWTVPVGITRNSDDRTLNFTTIWLSGGSSGMAYDLTNRVVSAGGRTEDRTITIRVTQR